jgi:hypothetical protein
MMGRLNHDQEQLFYEFQLDEVVADDHLVREIAAVLDLSWVHSELEPLLLAARPPVDRSGTHDPDAHRRLCFAIRCCDCRFTKSYLHQSINSGSYGTMRLNDPLTALLLPCCSGC